MVFIGKYHRNFFSAGSLAFLTGGCVVVVANQEEGWIGFRLNILGIRVWPGKCQLVAKTAEQWMVLGPQRTLPLKVPSNPKELAQAASDPLLITAFQYVAEQPASDLADLLAQKKDFPSALAAAG